MEIRHRRNARYGTMFRTPYSPRAGFEIAVQAANKLPLV
jgi:hypothetical protein